MRHNRELASVIVFALCTLFTYESATAQDTDAKKSAVYSKLTCCSCRVSFETCTCAEAKEIKAYADALLENGMSEEDILYKAAKKFSINILKEGKPKQDIASRLAQEAGPRHPGIVLDKHSFNVGRVSKKQGKISEIFKLSNTGNGPLTIKNLKTFCPCATISLETGKIRSPFFGTQGAPGDWQLEIKPGGKATIELAVDLSSPHVKAGKMIREASIISNDPVYPELSIKVEAEVGE